MLSVTVGATVILPVKVSPSLIPRSITGFSLSTINFTSVVSVPFVTFNVCSPLESVVVSISVPTAFTAASGTEKLTSIYGHIPAESPMEWTVLYAVLKLVFALLLISPKVAGPIAVGRYVFPFVTFNASSVTVKSSLFAVGR